MTNGAIQPVTERVEIPVLTKQEEALLRHLDDENLLGKDLTYILQFIKERRETVDIAVRQVVPRWPKVKRRRKIRV